MKIANDVLKHIMEHINKSYFTQEAQIRRKFREYNFSIKDIDTILENLAIDNTMIEVDKEKLYEYLIKSKFSYIKRFMYEYEKNEKKVIRELDFDLTFLFFQNENELINLTFIGDIKKTDEYLWVFIEEREKIHFFPFYEVYSTLEHYSKTNPFLWWKHFPSPFKAFENIEVFRPSGEIADKNEKAKESKKSNFQRIREMFDQVVDGTNAKIENIKETVKLGGFKTVKNIVVPVLIISSTPLSVSQLPIPDKTLIRKENSLLYYFVPSVVPKVNLWRFPILIIEQSKVLETIKKYTVAIFAQLQSRKNFERFTKK